MTKNVQPSKTYLNQLTKLREKIRQAMLGLDWESQSELRFVEKKVVEKIKQVKKELSKKAMI